MRRYRIDAPEFSEINITPLTDVVLVLLLVFMVASPALLAGALPVNVPEVATESEAPPGGLTVSIDASRRVFVENEQTPLDSVEALVARALADRTDRVVVLRADTSARHGEVVEVLAAVQRAGGRPVLGVERPEQAPTP